MIGPDAFPSSSNPLGDRIAQMTATRTSAPSTIQGSFLDALKMSRSVPATSSAKGRLLAPLPIDFVAINPNADRPRSTRKAIWANQ